MVVRSLVALVVTSCALVWVRSAEACGGTFCDRPAPGATPMQVDQSGENVLFFQSDGFVEAHVQIQYTGDPERFAWLVPMPAAPDIRVGSERLFDALLDGTTPTVTLNASFESCADGRTRSSGGCGFGAASNDGDSAAFDDAAPERSEVDPEIGDTEQVGAFDVTVLEPTAAGEVSLWLEENGFLDAPGASDIVQEYVDEGNVFVAVKFSPGAGVNEIHPLVFRYEGSEPCIPLRLTRIAATEDMPVRVFFLGERRVFPTNYAHVRLNPARIDWPGLASNYMDVVRRAVDEAPSGLGFITEYAGGSGVVDSTDVSRAEWDAEVFRTAAPEDVIDLLSAQGLVSCTSPSTCEATHALVLPIVRRYLPAPTALGERAFYQCVRCYADQINREAWDGEAFADELTERVILPGEHAVDMLGRSTYVSRLLTTISPREMTRDPMFAAQPAGGAGVSSELQATLHNHCAGDTAMRGTGLPDYALDGRTTPRFDGMPYAIAIDTYDDDGSRVASNDRRSEIELAISEWNDAQGYPPPPPERRRSSSSRVSCGVAAPVSYHAGDALLLFVLAALVRRRRRQLQLPTGALGSPDT